MSTIIYADANGEFAGTGVTSFGMPRRGTADENAFMELANRWESPSLSIQKRSTKYRGGDSGPAGVIGTAKWETRVLLYRDPISLRPGNTLRITPVFSGSFPILSSKYTFNGTAANYVATTVTGRVESLIGPTTVADMQAYTPLNLPVVVETLGDFSISFDAGAPPFFWAGGSVDINVTGVKFLSIRIPDAYTEYASIGDPNNFFVESYVHMGIVFSLDLFS